MHQRPYGEREREVAAMAAATLLAGSQPVAADIDISRVFTRFLALVSGARLRVKISPVTWEQGAPLGNPAHSRPTTFSAEGAAIMKDTDQVHASLEFDDAKGFATVDANAVSWSVDDPSVATVQPDADGSGGVMFVAGNPGSTVGRVTDGVVSGSVALDVTAGDVASIKVVLGDPVPQPTA